MRIKIATDSTADIPQELCRALNISVLPLTIHHDGKEYRDGIDITPEKMYEILDTAKTLPVSSQVSLPLYSELFEKTWKEGFTDLVHVTLNAKGSGTYQAAIMAKDMFFEENPEAAKDFSIHIIDSGTYSMTYGIGVVEAAQMVQAGADLEQVLAHLEDWLAHARPLFVPLDLKCVKKSGRISPAAAFVGDAIGLKPLITFEDGEAKIIDKMRGESKAIAAMVERCMKERRPGTSYVLVHGSNMEAFQKLKDACAAVMDQPPLLEYPVGCIIGINTGPNMLGLLYRT